MSKDAAYDVRIVRRDFYGQTSDDWHATITRRCDGKQTVLIGPWRWLVRWRVRRATLDREYRALDRLKRRAEQMQELAR